MISEKQLTANRANSKKSSGPRSAEGKAVVRRNALRHGFFSSDSVILESEDRQVYDRLLIELTEDLQPQGRMEELLVERIAIDHWRIRRIIRYESGQVLNARDEYLDQAVAEAFVRMPHVVPVSGRGLPESRRYMLRRRPGEEVTEEELRLRFERLERLRRSTSLQLDERLLEFIIREKLNGLVGEPEEELRKTARGYFDNLSPQIQGKLKKELIAAEEAELAYLDEEFRWNRKYQVISQILSLPGQADLEKIARFESSIQRNIHRNLAALLELQKRRKEVR